MTFGVKSEGKGFVLGVLAWTILLRAWLKKAEQA